MKTDTTITAAMPPPLPTRRNRETTTGDEMSKINDTIIAIEDYFFDLRSDARRFEEKGNMSAGTRARKGAAAVMKLCKELREAIQQAKNDAKV